MCRPEYACSSFTAPWLLLHVQYTHKHKHSRTHSEARIYVYVHIQFSEGSFSFTIEIQTWIYFSSSGFSSTKSLIHFQSNQNELYIWLLCNLCFLYFIGEKTFAFNKNSIYLFPSCTHSFYKHYSILSI